MRTILLFFILLGCWLLLSGHYTPLIISLGVVSCGFTAVMAHLIGGADKEGLPTHLFARLPGYVIWLIREIITSNIATAKTILKGTSNPEWFEVAASQNSGAGVATYANSITLTPGTVTVDVHMGADTRPVFLVQALHPDFADDVRSGEMDRRVTALEGNVDADNTGKAKIGKGAST